MLHHAERDGLERGGYGRLDDLTLRVGGPDERSERVVLTDVAKHHARTDGRLAAAGDTECEGCHGLSAHDWGCGWHLRSCFLEIRDRGIQLSVAGRWRTPPGRVIRV